MYRFPNPMLEDLQGSMIHRGKVAGRVISISTLGVHRQFNVSNVVIYHFPSSSMSETPLRSHEKLFLSFCDVFTLGTTIENDT